MVRVFGSRFLKQFLKIVFENTKNTILEFFKKCSSSLNLVFFGTKQKLGTKGFFGSYF